MLRPLLLVTLAVAFGLALHKVHAHDYAAPDTHEYIESLKMPDAPTTSCCGEGDVYYADDTWTDGGGSLYAVVTDTRPDDINLADGRVIHRQHIPVGTKVLVPPSKIRKKPIPNPTGHTIIFLGGNVQWGLSVYCYEPQPLN